MTLRNILRSYLGWCPGFNRVIAYSSKEYLRLNYRWLMLSTAIFLGIIVTSSTLMSPPPLPITPGSPLQIYIGSGLEKGVYLDTDFNQTFDYSVFNGPSYFEPVNASEYAQGSEIEINTYWFSTLDEVYNYTLGLNIPNSIRQYIRWLISQDFNSTYLKVFGKVRAGRYGSFTTNCGHNFYPPNSGYADYSITRSGNYGGINNNEGWDGVLVLTDGVSMVKHLGISVVWYLGIEGCAESSFTSDQRYRVRIVHYPKGNNFSAVIN